jgi:transposase-like protein
MAKSRVNYSSGFKDEAVRLVIETSRPIADVARVVQAILLHPRPPTSLRGR